MLRLRIVGPRTLPEVIPTVTTVQDNKPVLEPVSKDVNEIHPYCKFPIKSELHRDLYDALQEKGYQCLTEYIDSKTNIQVTCPFGHTWSALARKLMIPCNNCKQCWKINDVKAKEKIAQVIQSYGGVQLKPYDAKAMVVKCEEGHIFERTANSINEGAWCMVCPTSLFAQAKVRFEQAMKENNLTVLSEYQGMNNLVHLMCDKGHTYWQNAAYSCQASGCSVCRGYTKEAGEIRFRKYIQDRGGIMTGKYINNRVEVSVVCDKGHNFDIAPYSTYAAGWCRECARACPKTAKTRPKRDKICPKHGEPLSRYDETCPNRGEVCPKHGENCSKQAEEKFTRNVALMRGIMMGTYANARTKVGIQCEFGHQFNMNPASVSRGRWCPECRGKCPIAAERKFKEAIAKREGTIVGQYINSHARTDVICSKGHEFKISQSDAVHGGSWCKVCGHSESRGERAVREYLVKKALEYDIEVTFDWYPNGRYDFSFSYEGRNFLVEFDGGQHFSYVHYFHKTEDRFNEARQRDINKTIAAIDNGYYLIRIADTDIFDIDDIIEEFIESPELSERLLVSDYEKYSWLFESLALLN